MDKIEFQKGYQEFPVYGMCEVAEILINGIQLKERIEKIDLICKRKDRYERASHYAYLEVSELIAWLEDEYKDDEGPYVMGCICGYPGCWPLEVRIKETEDSIIWRHFTNEYLDEHRYDALGPFEFDKEQYLEQIKKLKEMCGEEE